MYQPDMLGLVRPGKGLPVLRLGSADFEQALHAWEQTKSLGDLADLLALLMSPGVV